MVDFQVYCQPSSLTREAIVFNKFEMFFSIGSTQFTGDLGGRDKTGKDYSFVDIDMQSTNVNFQFGGRYLLNPYFSTSLLLGVGKLKGDDALTSEIIRKSRNLKFESTIFHIEKRIEAILMCNDIGARTKKNKFDYRFYVYSGIGLMRFNPKSDFQGVQYELQPLHTEGQGVNGIEPYKLYTAIIPFGVGYRFSISRYWNIGIEATYYKTFSDYIDDVHGVYADPSVLNSPQAQYFSNPSQSNQDWFSPGQQRGDKNNDAFYTFNIQVIRKIKYLHKHKRPLAKPNYKF